MATINLTMDGDKSVCAFFKKKKYTLTIIASNGTVTGAGTYNAGTSISVKATANAGYKFSNWSGDLTGSVNPATIVMNKNKTVTANFVVIPVVKYTLATSVDPIDSGTITGAGSYPAGTEVTVVATPAVDYDFDHWSGEAVIPVGAILPQDYATGDGTKTNPWANDCIKKVYDACPDNGIIYLKAGYYILSDCVEITKELSIIGENRENTIIKTSSKTGLYSNDVDSITLKNFTVDGNAQQDGTQYLACISVNNGDNITLDDIEVINSGYYGIDIYQVNHSLFQNIYAHDNYRHGLHPGSDVSERNAFNTYKDIQAWNNGVCGFSDRGTSVPEQLDNTYDNIQAWNNGEHGIRINTLKGGSLSNSSATGNKADGIWLFDVHDFSVNNCSNLNNESGGVELDSCSNITLTNVISKNNNFGLILPLGYIGLCSDIYLVNCQLSPNKITDIYNPNGVVVTIINN